MSKKPERGNLADIGPVNLMQKKIRQAVMHDADRIVKLAKMAHKESPVYRDFPPEVLKFRQSMASMIVAKRYYSGVIDKNDVVQGFLLGYTEDMDFVEGKQASDWMFYVLPEERGYTPHLIRDFIKWGWEQKGVVRVGLTNSAGIHIEKTEALYSKMGLSRIGGIWFDRYV